MMSHSIPTSARSHYVWYEPVSILYVSVVRLSDSREQRFLLDSDAVQVGRYRRNGDQHKAGPASQRQTNPREHHDASRIRWMPNESIRPGAYHRLIRPRSYIAGEILAEGAPAVAAQQAAEQNQSDADREEWQLQPLRERQRSDESEKKSTQESDPHTGYQHA